MQVRVSAGAPRVDPDPHVGVLRGLQDHPDEAKPLTSKRAFYETCKINYTEGADGDIGMDLESQRALCTFVLDGLERPRAI